MEWRGGGEAVLSILYSVCQCTSTLHLLSCKKLWKDMVVVVAEVPCDTGSSPVDLEGVCMKESHGIPCKGPYLS